MNVATARVHSRTHNLLSFAQEELTQLSGKMHLLRSEANLISPIEAIVAMPLPNDVYIYPEFVVGNLDRLKEIWGGHSHQWDAQKFKSFLYVLKNYNQFGIEGQGSFRKNVDKSIAWSAAKVLLPPLYLTLQKRVEMKRRSADELEADARELKGFVSNLQGILTNSRLGS